MNLGPHKYYWLENPYVSELDIFDIFVASFAKNNIHKYNPQHTQDFENYLKEPAENKVAGNSQSTTIKSVIDGPWWMVLI